MKADISRRTFRRTRHYSGVLLQQGRVQLDADFNEQAAISDHRGRVATRDTVGPSGAPEDGGGFALSAAVLLEGLGVSGSVGVAVGEHGTLLVLLPAEGEPIWQARDSGTPVDLHAVSMVDGDHAWAVGDGTTIVRGVPTSDEAWEVLPTPEGVASELRGLHFRDLEAGVAVGTGAVVLATGDGGDTWTAQALPGGVVEDLNAVHFPTPDAGFAVGASGRILAFADGAWAAQSAPAGFTATLRAVRFANAQEGWAAGDGGALLATADGGATWALCEPPLGVTATLRALAFDSGTVWAAGDDATLIRSADGGATWARVTAPDWMTADFRAVVVLPSSILTAGDLSTIADVNIEGGWTLNSVPLEARDLSISAGRSYVDGVLCENERDIRYGDQDDLPGPPDGDTGLNLVYLDVWERHVTALEDGALREVALGGPDTATRTKTVWQVKLADIEESPTAGTCDPFPPGWVPATARSTGRLRARAEEAQIQTNECMVPLGGGYRRLENQLYRVEIHTPGTGSEATYKWSRDNGSVVARLVAIDPKSPSDFSSGELTISEPGRDTVIGFAGAAVIELSDEGRVLRGEPGFLLEVDTITGNAIKWKGYTGP
ncbi:MAG TPA: DUF6519 domain-containing protein, partial [Solirubrobacter sp.]